MTKEEERYMVSKMTDEELRVYLYKKELEHTATVGYLIDYLKNHFKPEDKVAYMNCIEGLKNDCEYVTRDQLGDRFFRYVKDDKKWNMTERHMSQEEVDKFFPYVDDNDVIVI